MSDTTKVVDQELVDAAINGEAQVRELLVARRKANGTEYRKGTTEDTKCPRCGKGHVDKRGYANRAVDIDGQVFGVDCAKVYRLTKAANPELTIKEVLEKVKADYSQSQRDTLKARLAQLATS